MPLLLLQGMRAGAAAQRDRPPDRQLDSTKREPRALEIRARPPSSSCAELPDDDLPARPSCAVSSHPSA